MPYKSSRSQNSKYTVTDSARSSTVPMSIPTDEEKCTTGPVSEPATARSFFGGSPRKRRMLAAGSVVLAVMVLGSRYLYVERLPTIGGFWKDTDDGTLYTQSRDDVLV